MFFEVTCKKAGSTGSLWLFMLKRDLGSRQWIATHIGETRGFQIQDEALLKFLDTPGAEHPRAIH